MSLTFVKPERVLLANHPEYREKWVQERIAEDPSILCLGDLGRGALERPKLVSD